jgi:hypothetical protein
MRSTICITVAAIALALPQLAFANGQRQDQAAFTHWWSMGSAGPEPVQNIDGKDIPGAPNGMLAEMKGNHASAKGAIAVDID